MTRCRTTIATTFVLLALPLMPIQAADQYSDAVDQVIKLTNFEIDYNPRGTAKDPGRYVHTFEEIRPCKFKSVEDLDITMTFPGLLPGDPSRSVNLQHTITYQFDMKDIDLNTIKKNGTWSYLLETKNKEKSVEIIYKEPGRWAEEEKFDMVEILFNSATEEVSERFREYLIILVEECVYKP